MNDPTQPADATPQGAAQGAAPVDDAYHEMISPSDMRIYKVRASQLEAYKKAGYVSREPDAGIQTHEIRKHFSSWMDAPEQLGIATIGGVPFMNKMITGLSSAENAKAWAERVKEVQDDHPYINFAGNVLGTGLTVAGAAAAAPVLGLGAAAGGAAAGAEGIGAALGAGTAAETIGGLALKGAATNMALGAVQRFDNAAIDHAVDPAGEEKLAFDLHDVMIDGILGGILPVGLKGASNVLLKRLGKAGENFSLKQGVKTISKVYETEAGIKQGIGDTDRMVMEEAFKAGPKDVKRKAADMVRVTGDKMEQVKIDLGNTVLNAVDRQDLLSDLHTRVGGTPALKRSLNVLQDGNFNMDHLMKLRQQLYKQVVWNQYDQNPMYQKADLAGQRVTAALHKMLADHDLTTGGTLAQQQQTLDNEYMAWSRLKTIIAPAPPDELPQLLTNIAGKGAMGAGVGATLQGLGMSVGGAGLGFGPAAAGIEAARTIKPYHVTKFAYTLSKYMQAADEHLTRAVEAGLYGAPAQVHNLRHGRSYEDVGSKIAMAAADPAGTMANLRQMHLEHGTPDDIADVVVARQHAKIMYLADKLPKRNDAADFATTAHGDPVQQNRFMGQVRTAQDPTYGILYPTKTNMEINKKFHPQTLNNAQQAVIQQVRRNPNMPARARAWASRLLERPVGNLNSPRFSQMLQEARAKMSQEEQQAAKPSGHGKTSVQSEGSGTRLDALQGGD